MAYISLRGIANSLGSNTVSGMVLQMGRKWPPPPPISIHSLFDPPIPPSNLRITGVTNTSVSLAWQNNATNANSYGVSWWLHGSTFFNGISLPAPNIVGMVMTYEIQGLQPDTLYNFRTYVNTRFGSNRGSNIITGATTTPKPTIQSFTATPSVVQICQPTAITLSWQVSNVQNITISRQGGVIVNQTNTGSANPWTASAQDPQAQDTNVTYTFAAFSGTENTSSSASITTGSNYPLIHTIQLTNNSSVNVDVWFYNWQGYQVQHLFSLSSGSTNTATIPDCELVNMEAIDGQGTARWESQLVLGNSQGQNYQSSFS